MESKIIFEIIGYVGSAFVLISFLMATVIKLRIINSIGSIISVIYGLLIQAYPTVIMNAVLLGINIFYLIKMYRYKVSFHIIPTTLSEASTKFFLNLNKDDISVYFPDFFNTADAQESHFSQNEQNYLVQSQNEQPQNVLPLNAQQQNDQPCNAQPQPDFVRLIYCENKIVGLFVAQTQTPGTLNILLDYTTKEYRDYSVGHYLFQALAEQNITTLQFSQNSSGHEKYLKKTGFKFSDSKYVLQLK